MCSHVQVTFLSLREWWERGKKRRGYIPALESAAYFPAPSMQMGVLESHLHAGNVSSCIPVHKICRGGIGE